LTVKFLLVCVCRCVSGGWTDIDMVRKYAHFGSEHLLEFAEKSVNAKPVDNLVPDTNLSQAKIA